MCSRLPVSGFVAFDFTHQYKKQDSSYDTRNLVTRTYDAVDRVLTETDAQAGVTSYTYDAAGNVLTATDPEGHTVHYQYDEMNRRTCVTDANSRKVTTAYDQAGHPVSEQAEFQHDAVGLFKMKFLLRRLRDFFVSLLFGVLAGGLFLSVDAFLCGEANSQNAAGGGAAIGMLAIVIAGGALLLALTVLSCIGLACHFGIIGRNQRWKFEVGGIAGLLVVLGWIVVQVESGLC